MREEEFTPLHKTNVLPLRWFADKVSEPISMFFFDIGLRRHDYLEMLEAPDEAFKKDFRLTAAWKLYHVLGYPYKWWGTSYTWNRERILDAINDMQVDMSGSEWDDYDENGHPYWYFTEWQEDPETGDAWRLIKNAEK